MMMFRTQAIRLLALTAALGVVVGPLALTAGHATASTAASTCPTVNPATGVVTPAPYPGIIWDFCNLSHADLAGVNLSYVSLAGANMTDANLSGAYLYRADLNTANLSGGSLSQARLPYTDLAYANLADVNVQGADLSMASLDEASSGGVLGTPSALPPNWSLVKGYLIGPYATLGGASLTGADLSGVDLFGTYLAHADLSDASLTGANLTGANLTGANLTGANLTSADLTSVTLNGTNLTSANLTGATLARADFLNTDLANTILTGADLTDVGSRGVSGTPSAFPLNWSLVSGYLIGPRANLSDTDLSGLDLSGQHLSGANLTGAKLAGTNLTGADLTGVESGGITGTPSALPLDWSLVSGYLMGPGANLSGANLKNADLNGADLSGADLAGVVSGGITGTPSALPGRWSLVRGYLIGPAASLEHAGLTGAVLAGADLAGADLSYAGLSGADLTNADLSDAILTYTDLATANLTDADFNGANLDMTNLTGATWTGATWTGATWTGAACPDGSNSDKHVDGCFSALDTTPPVAAPAVIAGTPGANGWYTSSVAVSWNWTDDGTINPAQCTASSSTTTSGDPVTLTATCTDRAGNVGTHSYPVKVETTTPVVAVTGVVPGRDYILGMVPAARCATTDAISGVATAATVKITTSGSRGVGKFTVTCSGAVSVAGTDQAQPVSVTYFVSYGFGGFSSPRPGSTLARSARTIAVGFRLTDAAGKAIASSADQALAAAHDVRVSLAGPGIKTVIARCRWSVASRAFSCTVGIPGGIKTGKSHRYTITAAVNLGRGFMPVPPTGKAANPAVIHFR